MLQLMMTVVVSLEIFRGYTVKNVLLAKTIFLSLDFNNAPFFGALLKSNDKKYRLADKMKL